MAATKKYARIRRRHNVGNRIVSGFVESELIFVRGSHDGVDEREIWGEYGFRRASHIKQRKEYDGVESMLPRAVGRLASRP